MPVQCPTRTRGVGATESSLNRWAGNGEGYPTPYEMICPRGLLPYFSYGVLCLWSVLTARPRPSISGQRILEPHFEDQRAQVGNLVVWADRGGFGGATPWPSRAPIDPNAGDAQLTRRRDVVVQALGHVQDPTPR